MKDKIILCAVHGRPSTKLAFSTMHSDATLIHKRVLRRSGRVYYRTFDDKELLARKIATGERFLFERKRDQLSLENSVVVRWGTREVLDTDNGTIIYNKASALANATDKRHSRELFIAQGVSTPKLIQCDGMATNEEYSDFPIIARPHTHSKGRNFVVLDTLDEFVQHWDIHNRSWYYSAFVDKEREFRIHVAHGKVLAVMEKPRPETDNIAWNRAQNETDPFAYVGWDSLDTEGLKPVLSEALRAVNAVGLDFGGVDVMLADGVAYVLEVNTAPTLNTSPYVASKWGQYFDWLFREDVRREHWEGTTEKQYAKSMLWKNWQLRDEEQE